jgi:hypothetical protein
MYVSRDSLRKIHHAVSVERSTPSTADKVEINKKAKCQPKILLRGPAITPFLERLLKE